MAEAEGSGATTSEEPSLMTEGECRKSVDAADFAP